MKLKMTTLAFASLLLEANCLITPSNALEHQRVARQHDPESLPIYKNSSYCVDASGPNGTLDTGNVPARRNSTENMIGEKHMTHFNLVGDITDAKQVAEFVNLVQQRALDTRLGIPVTLSTDPQHHFTENIGTGFHGREIGPHSVTPVTKHFPGGGPMENGEDSHFPYGKDQTYPGNHFEYHLTPFRAAIAAGARQMMLYYSRPIGLFDNSTDYEPVGFSFNKQIVTDLLRNQLGFEGIVVTDWGLITDTVIRACILDAGRDQFGGEQRTELIVQLVEEGIVSEDRLDISTRRLLRERFLLGLFDNPFVDPEAATRVTRMKLLPLKHVGTGTKFYIEGLNATFLEARNLTVVERPEEADYGLLRINAPYEPRPGGFEAAYHAGSLEYSDEEKARQAAIYAAVPTIVDVILDRPAAIPEVFDAASAVLCSYGSGSEAFLDVIFGSSNPEGKLPFDLPRSQQAVEDAMEDVPYDTADPVFRFGHGLRYADKCSL
ncbi:glycosyl hydrolase family 3 N terminal domain-containing protein [Colletotrichum salicis]|uniref:beta-glucosidase n=1 Tax=Colletotrichum salicis TaxID=1209931 RepID=A0A135V9N4_9PEZI|nr:glycosyl hydrolase family 3 N terminal domain-containing protein [Colletotrichum salicis]